MKTESNRDCSYPSEGPKNIGRRTFVRLVAKTTASIGVMQTLAGCGRRDVLRVANWADLIGSTTLADFERESGCSVIYENYSSNEEIHSKVKLRPDAYDVVFPSDYMVQQLSREGLLAPLKHEKFKNLGNLEPSLQGHEYDPRNEFCFPYTYWGTGIAVNQARYPLVPNEEMKWESLFAPAAAGRITVLDEMRYTLGMALLMNGKSVNTVLREDLEIAVSTLKRLKPSLMAFVTDVKDLLIKGETSLSYAYSGDVFQASKANKQITFRVPVGGGIIGIDNMCITRSARQPKLAIAFLDYLMKPEVAAGITGDTFYATANRAAVEKKLIPPEIVDNPVIYIPLQQASRLNVLRDVGASDNRLYVQAWDEVKRS
jgi:spermidine/putrescine transport system substrate-binding protein